MEDVQSQTVCLSTGNVEGRKTKLQQVKTEKNGIWDKIWRNLGKKIIVSLNRLGSVRMNSQACVNLPVKEGQQMELIWRKTQITLTNPARVTHRQHLCGNEPRTRWAQQRSFNPRNSTTNPTSRRLSELHPIHECSITQQAYGDTWFTGLPWQPGPTTRGVEAVDRIQRVAPPPTITVRGAKAAVERLVPVQRLTGKSIPDLAKTISQWEESRWSTSMLRPNQNFHFMYPL